MFMSVSLDHTMKVWKINSSKCVQSYRLPSYGGSIIQLIPGAYIVGGGIGDSGFISLWPID